MAAAANAPSAPPAPAPAPGASPAARTADQLRASLLPDLVSKGVFGEGWRMVEAQAVPIGGLGEDHWASTTLAVTLHLDKQGDKQTERTLSLVAKCMIAGDGWEGFSLPDVQAENETYMYSKVLPFLSRLFEESGEPVQDLYPRCYFTSTAVPDMISLTVLEDMRPRGFRLAKERTALDRQHVNLAMRAIGRLHAASHVAKARYREEFMSLARTLQETCYTPASHARWTMMLHAPAMRGVSRLKQRLEKEILEQRPAGAEVTRDRLRRLEERVADPFLIMQDAAKPQEPNGVITHGDFCGNNMLFHFGPDAQPDGTCLFDFQNSRYCSPSVDLSFFLLLNTSPSLRAAHWDDLIGEYFGSLESTISKLLEGHEPHPDFVMPTLQSVREDLKRHALWGYVICSFFLPQMMVPREEIPDMDAVKDLTRNNMDAAMEWMVSIGGEQATELLADMVLEFLDRDLVP